MPKSIITSTFAINSLKKQNQLSHHVYKNKLKLETLHHHYRVIG